MKKYQHTNRNVRLTFKALFSCLALGIFASCSSDDPIRIKLPTSGAVVKNGEYLATTLTACGFCHGNSSSPNAMLTGGRSFFDKYGAVAASNLTPAESALKDWQGQDLIKVFRSNRSKNGRDLSREVHRGFEWMSDDDIISISAYLATIPPVRNEVEVREVGFIDRNTTGFMDVSREVKGYVPPIDKRFTGEYGEYLVNSVARCGFCHNTPASFFTSDKYLGGGATIQTDNGEAIAPGIDGSEQDGLGAWQEKDIVTFLRKGVTPSGRNVDRRFCPVDFYSNASEEDLTAIARYLKTVPPAS